MTAASLERCGGIRDSRPRNAGATQCNLCRLERMCEGIVHRRGLVATMRHALRTLLVAARAVALPFGFFHKRFEARRIPFADQKVARLLPAKDVACGIAPRCASIALVAGEIVEVQAGVVEPPASPFGAPEDVAVQGMHRIALQKHILPGRTLIAETGRDRDRFHA